MFSQKYAQVLANIPLLHVDRPFDYVIPENLLSKVAVGSRVAITFGGRKAVGFVVSLSDSVERPEKVSEIEDVIDLIPVIKPEIFDLAKAVSERYIATQGDVLGSTVPLRQARTEAKILGHLPVGSNPITNNFDFSECWNFYSNGHHFLDRLGAGEVSRASCVVGPGHDIYRMAVDAVIACRKSGKGALVALPDGKEVNRLITEFQKYLSKEDFAVFGSDQKPSERYANFLNVLRGDVQIAIGTRSAVFAPVENLGLVVIIEDGDDSHSEQQNPAWHAREVLALRSLNQECSFLALSHSRSVEVQIMVERDWVVDLVCERNYLRSNSPKVYATSDADLAKDPVARHARLPQMVFTAIRRGLIDGPVLVQVPRRGYQLHLSCSQCREPVDCKECHGGVQRSSEQAPVTCMRCGHQEIEWKCQWCGNRKVRSTLAGEARTAEELGRAFPGVVVKTSGKNAILESVENQPSLVIATPGAEPFVEDGFYQAAIILDAELSLRRIDLRAEEESFRRWRYVNSLVKPQTGQLVIVADEGKAVVQSLIRHDAIGFAQRELESRKSAHMAPVFGITEIRCDTGMWLDAIKEMKLPADTRILGPVQMPDRNPNIPPERVLLSYPRSSSAAVNKVVRAFISKRTASKAKGKFHAKVDPISL